jgi:hypothetical protein
MTGAPDRISSSDPLLAACPDQSDVDALRELLDLMVNFPDNDQRARYLLSCNWMRDRDAAIAAKAKGVQIRPSQSVSARLL